MKTIREIRVKDLVTYFLIPLIFLIAAAVGYALIFSKLSLFWKIASGVFFLFIIYYPLKRFVIGIVLMYKAFAPMKVRDRCRFEPTCSTYMIMAINKYGLFKGVFKGIKRLLRCKAPNGGIDYP